MYDWNVSKNVTESENLPESAVISDLKNKYINWTHSVKVWNMLPNTNVDNFSDIFLDIEQRFRHAQKTVL